MANATKPTVTKEKMVKIKIPFTKLEKDDVYVAINGRSWLIKRGVEVEVPECVVKVIENSERQSMESMEYEAQASANADQ